MSLHSRMPMRIVETKKIFRNLSPAIQKEIRQITQGRGFFRKLPKVEPDLVEHFSNRNNSPWITRPSNAHPLVEYLKENKVWQAWEHCYVGAWVERLAAGGGNRDEGRVIVEPYFHESMKMAAYPLHICHSEDRNLDFRGFLIVGPLFLPPDNNSAETFTETLVKPFVDKVRADFSPSDLRNEYDIDEYDIDEMLKRGMNKSWIVDTDLAAKTGMLGRAMRCLFNLRFESETKVNLPRSSYNSVAQVVFLLQSQTVQRKIAEAAGDLPLSLGFYLKPRDEDFALVAEYHKHRRPLKMVPCKRKDFVWVETGEHLSRQRKRDLALSIQNMRRDLEGSYADLQQGYANERLRRLRHSLDERFGLVSAHPIVYPRKVSHGDGEQPSTASKDLHETAATPGDSPLQTAPDPAEMFDQQYKAVTREITSLFSADIARIFRYDYTEKCLKTAVVHFDGEYTDEQRRKCHEGSTKVMLEASKNDELRVKSISYRCVDKKSARMCRAWDKDAGEAIPSTEPLLNVEGIRPCRAAISVPLKVHGRLFGALEIAGLSPQQFRYQNLNLAEHVADVVGDFFYQKEVLTTLQGLSDEIQDHRTSDEVKYKRICEEMARIFLAHSALLYLPNLRRQDRYDIVAWHNVHGLGDCLSKSRPEYFLPKDREDSPTIAAVQLKHPFLAYNLTEHQKTHPKWLQGPPQRGSLDKQFEWGVIVPATHSESGFLCALSLYYEAEAMDQAFQQQPLSRSWEPTVKFVSEYLAVLVMAVHTRRYLEERAERIFLHELKQSVDSVRERARRIVDILKEPLDDYVDPAYMASYLRNKVALKYKDIESYEIILLRLAEMLRTKDFRKLAETGVDSVRLILEATLGAEEDKPDDTVDIRSVFYENVQPHLNSLTSKKIRFENRCESRPHLKTNRALFNRLVQNLLDNAAKYSVPRSEILAAVEVKKRSITIRVSNRGRPLETAGEQYSLFLEGFRGSNTTEKAGDGLGLAICRSISKILGGGIRLRIPVKQQAYWKYEFIVTLPIRLVSE